jgi:hypothetical protein
VPAGPSIAVTPADLIDRAVDRLRATADELAAFSGALWEADDINPILRASALLAERRRRDTTLPNELFGEPVWDLMLSLFVAQKTGQDVHQTEAIRFARVADTTGLRLMEQLVSAGILVRTRRSGNRKDWSIRLSADCEAKLESFLASAPTGAPPTHAIGSERMGSKGEAG